MPLLGPTRLLLGLLEQGVCFQSDPQTLVGEGVGGTGVQTGRIPDKTDREHS